MSLDEIKAKAFKTIEAQMKTPRRYPPFYKVPQKVLTVGLVTKMPEWRKIKGRERLLLEWNVEGAEYTLDCTPVVLQQKIQELMVQGLLKSGSMLWVYNAGPDQGRRWHHWFAGVETAPGAQA
jgi:hypothetical protein